MTMVDWKTLLDKFLEFTGRPVLDGAGSISALQAKQKAEAEYSIFRVRQDAEYLSDFDRFAEEVRRLKGS